MKKKSYLIIPFLLLLTTIFGQSQKKTDKPNPMKGVKTLTKSKYIYEEKFGEFIEVLEEKIIH